MHKYLYKDQMPSTIRSCLGASALYSSMTSSNKTSVLRILCQSLNELKEQQSANTPQEKLARTQALFLYQIIGIFDGDVTLRSNADRNMLLLQDWLDDLCKIRENLLTPESMNVLNPPRSWEVCTFWFRQYPLLTGEVVDIFRVCPANYRHSLCLLGYMEYNVR